MTDLERLELALRRLFTNYGRLRLNPMTNFELIEAIVKEVTEINNSPRSIAEVANLKAERRS